MDTPFLAAPPSTPVITAVITTGQAVSASGLADALKRLTNLSGNQKLPEDDEIPPLDLGEPIDPVEPIYRCPGHHNNLEPLECAESKIKWARRMEEATGNTDRPLSVRVDAILAAAEKQA